MLLFFTRKRLFLTATFLLAGLLSYAQVTLSGSVSDAGTSESLAGVNIAVRGKVIGTVTDTKGRFSLTTTTPAPFTILVSSVGYETQEIDITGNRTDLQVKLTERATLGEEVIVSASRVEESVMKSPVSVEKLDIRAIQSTPATSFYEALRNIKGVEMSTQSLTFSNFNARGFSGNGNVRVVQLVDGMDTQAPGLNFSVANIIGLSDLDVESTELLPGAASALYGPNALNGLLLTTSKSPFRYQGLSAYVRGGLMNASNRTKRYSDEKLGATPFSDIGFRYAKAFNNKVAFKIGASYLQAQDWQATDYRDQSLANGVGLEGTRETNRAYDGINIYGDVDPGFTAYQVLRSALASPAFAALNTGVNQVAGLLGPAAGLTQAQAYDKILTDLYAGPLGFRYSRTGYRERDLVDYNAKSIKLNGSLHYRINENVEALLQANWGTGTTVYTGADRYYIKNFSIGQYKAELRGSNFFLRAYTTQERSGDSYASGIAGLGVNKTWVVANGRVDTSPTSVYFATLAGGFAGATFPGFATNLQTRIAQGQNPLLAYQTAVGAVAAAAPQTLAGVYQQVGTGRVFVPGSAEFETQLNTVINKPIPGDAGGVGAKFQDKTNLYHFEGMYNFSKVIDPKDLELIVGSNYRRYQLNSGGTIFINEDGEEPIIGEYGVYSQVSKNFADKLKLTASARYDKNENFKGQFSPRVSAVFTAGANHNFRTSFQTGFRIPTTQNQYIDLLTPQARLIGGLPKLIDKYQLRTTTINLATGQPFAFPEFKPERIQTFEAGYKGLIANKLVVDLYYYNSVYKDFIGATTLIKPTSATTREVYSISTNYGKDIKTQGFGLGIDYTLPKSFQVGFNVSNNTLNTGGVKLFSTEPNKNTLDDGFQAGFNTPKYRYNVSFGNRNIGRSGWGFNIVWRHQDEFEWQSSIGNPNINISSDSRNRPIIPAYGTLDAQISKKISPIRSILKIGGTNILQKEYTTGWANPTVGSMFYVGLTFDEFLN